MKRVQKNVLGLSGLALVATMTTAAALLPAPEASATTSVTDTLVVRVVGQVPDMELEAISPRVISGPVYRYKLTYENIDTIELELIYTNLDGVVKRAHLGVMDVDYEPETQEMSINLQTVRYDEEMTTESLMFSTAAEREIVTLNPYGHYRLMATGQGYDTEDVEYLEFEYVPVTAEAEQDGNSVNITFGEIGEDVEELEIIDDEGNITLVDPADLPANRTVKIPTHSNCVPKMTINAYGRDEDGNRILLYTSLVVFPCTEIPVPDTNAPDTGGLFQNLNISKEDYLVTGLIVFFVLGIVAFGVVARSRKSKRV